MTQRVAIIGAGIGAEHLAGYLTLTDQFTVACICDIDKARANALALPHGIATDDTLDNILAEPEIDIVDICLPPHLHLSACLASLDAGKTVICEKPLVTSMADANKLAARIDQIGGRVFPVFQYRFGLGHAQLQALMDSGLAGTCYAGTLETHWDRDAAYYAVDWRGTWDGEQGGALLGHAIHIHDLLSAILGPVARLYAETATRVNEIEVEDCAALSLRMACGALITSSITLGAAGNSSRLRLMFEGFTAESDHAPYAPATKPWRFLARSPVAQEQVDDVLASVETPLNGFAGLLHQIANELDGRPSKAVSFEDGRRSIELVTAAYTSARTGKPVDLPLGEDALLFEGWRP